MGSRRDPAISPLSRDIVPRPSKTSAVTCLPMARPCIICGEKRKLTVEHVWPQWMTDCLPGEKGSPFRYRRGRSDAPTPPWFARDNDGKLDARAKRLCDVCRQRINEAIEDPAQATVLCDLIRGQEIPIPAEQRQVLATWISKTALLAEYTYGDDQRNFPEVPYAALNSDLRRPPTGAWVWVAVFRGDRPDGVSHRSYRVSQNEVTGPPSVSTGGLTTFFIGHLACQFLWTGSSSFIPIPLSSPWEDIAVQLWPAPDPVQDWPPTAALSEETFELWAEIHVRSSS